MVRLKDDRATFSLRGTAAAAARPVRLVMPFLIFVSLCLLLLSRLNHSALNEARWRVASWMSPALEVAMVPLAPFRQMAKRVAAQVDLSSELERLRAENQKLSNWEWRARGLEQRLSELEALSRVVNEPKLAFITARVIADSSGAFARTVIISAGRNQNLKPGYPVISADGLVGRIVNTGSDSARVLLASDLNSRIPVTIGKGGVRAILAGDNGPLPRLLYIPPGAGIAIGDDIATSGTGGLFPSGLRIGKVMGDLSSPRVALRANLDKLEYVSVLFFDDPAQGLLGELTGVPSRGRASNEEYGGASRAKGGAP